MIVHGTHPLEELVGKRPTGTLLQRNGFSDHPGEGIDGPRQTHAVRGFRTGRVIILSVLMVAAAFVLQSVRVARCVNHISAEPGKAASAKSETRTSHPRPGFADYFQNEKEGR
jgi:hypothetical protein